MIDRVLLALPGAFSGHGGIETYNRQLVRAFLELGREQGFKVRTSVLNDRPEDLDERNFPPGAERPVGFEGSKVRFLAATLHRILVDRPDLVVFGHLHFAKMAALVRRASSKPRYWYVAYGIEAWHPLSATVRRGLGDADRVLSISEYTREEITRNGGLSRQRTSLLPCALDPAWQEQYLPEMEPAESSADGRPRLLTVARLVAAEQYKGVDSVIRALPAIVEGGLDVLYDVVGDGDDRPRLEAIAREAGVSERVRFHGRLRPDALAAAYRRCMVYVMPSSHEGFGIAFLEAAHFGKPSVGGNHGGTPEVIQDGVTGMLVDRQDIRAIAKAIRSLLGDEALRSRMGRAARDRLLERFQYPTFKRTLEDLLSERFVLREPETGPGARHREIRA